MALRDLTFLFKPALIAIIVLGAGAGRGENLSRTIAIENSYLNFPVKNGAPIRHVTVSVNGIVKQEFDIELADAAPDWWAFLDAKPLHGQTVEIKVDKLPDGSGGLSAVDQSNEIKGEDDIYHEARRPQFHFTSRHGWLNDPNGLVYYHGEYHLFYQHNPYGWNPGNLSWGHAVSKDLVHWHELPVAIYADDRGAIWSGSAVVDWNNTAGFQTGKEPALVAMFTDAKTPFGQWIAFSNDRGRYWTKYDGNPVLPHIAAENRDPKVTWFAPENKWVMALYLDHNDFNIFDSTDLKHWNLLQSFTVPGDAECPNFFELPGIYASPKWVFYAASGVYVIGSFDGKRFTPETQPQHLQNGNCWYASQVYSGIPKSDGRCILIPWGRLPDGEMFRGESFNQMMGLPVELGLRLANGQESLSVTPVRELNRLRKSAYSVKAQTLAPGDNPLAGIYADLLEIEAEIATGQAGKILFDLRGMPVTYEAASEKIHCLGNEATLVPDDGKIQLHFYVDRASIDIFGGGGTLYMPMAKVLSPDNQDLALTCEGGNARVVSLKFYKLKSAW